MVDGLAFLMAPAEVVEAAPTEAAEVSPAGVGDPEHVHTGSGASHSPH